MLLTLATCSFADLIARNGHVPGLRSGAAKSPKAGLTLLDLPGYAIRQFGLRGLNVNTSMLAGWSLHDLDRLRDRADKAGCPCLVLVEDSPLSFIDDDPNRMEAMQERVRRLALAANRLGCSAMGVRFDAPATDDAFELVAAEIRDLMPVVEQFELTMLIRPYGGLADTPDRLTALIKRIGTFRIGCLPSFAHAAASPDPIDVLRQLAPYAGAIHATVEGFDKAGAHRGYDLREFVAAIRSVGFANTLAVEFTGAKDREKTLEQACAILREAIQDETE